LTGVRFTDGVEFVFPSLILAPGGCTVVAGDSAALQSRYGGQARIGGRYSGRPSDAGEQIVLTLPQPLEAAILRFSYGVLLNHRQRVPAYHTAPWWQTNAAFRNPSTILRTTRLSRSLSRGT